MKIFEFTHIGQFHTNYNEDFLVVEDIGQNNKLIAVMDGCSSGTDSHFAATLIGKLLRKIAKHEAYLSFAKKISIELSALLKNVALQLFEELVNLNRQLDLRYDELLSTLIIAIVDTEKKTAELLVAGDGFIHVNGQNFEYENDNKPDYIGYHLNIDKHLWFQTKTKKKSVVKLEDLTISTDGIHTFKNFDDNVYKKISQEEIFFAFFENEAHTENENKLKKTFIKLKEENGLLPTDDLTMIRVMNV